MRRLQLTLHGGLLGIGLILTFLIGQPVKSKADRGCLNPRLLPGNPMSSFEPGQRAIILWNGSEQILLLSTDLSHPLYSNVTEVIPLPAEPTVKAGNLETFSEIVALAARKGVDLTDVLPAFALGSMSNLVISAADSPREFAFSANNNRIRPVSIHPSFMSIIANYQRRGYRWFVFDDINLQPFLQSFPPVEYKFKTEKIFYPFEISILDHGETKVDLIIISANKLSAFSETDFLPSKSPVFQIDASDLAKLSAEWPAFMKPSTYFVQHLHIVGDIRKMVKDFLAQ